MFPFVLLLFPLVYLCRHVLVTSLSLFPVLSFQWIVGLSVTFDGPVFFQYTYVVLCSGQVKYQSKFSSERESEIIKFKYKPKASKRDYLQY